MDIEKAIVILKDEDCFWNSPEKDILEAIKHILAEREADKKRIKELEEENKKYIIKLTNEEYKRVIDVAQEDIKKQFKQKVKDKIEEIKKEENLYARINIIQILQDLLEDK